MKTKSLELLASLKKHQEFSIKRSKDEIKKDIQELKNQINLLEENKTIIQKKIKKMFFNKEEIHHYIFFLKKAELFLQKLNTELREKKEILEEYRLKLENIFKKRKILEKIILKHYSKSKRCFSCEQVD